MSDAIAPAIRCKNCDAALAGHFCARCGQAADVHVPSTKELIHEALEGITHSDSRLWSTLRLLWFKPGALTRAFIAGRRMAFLPPIRLYLVMSVVFFLAASANHSNTQIVVFDGAEKQGQTPQATCADVQFELFGSHRWEERVRHACEATVVDQGASLQHVAMGLMPRAMFIFLPLIAFLHMLLYWRPRHRYAEHLLFFLHLHAFFFSVMALMILSSGAAKIWSPLAPVAAYLVPMLGWTLPLYSLLAIKRVFERSWTRTVLKTLALFFVYVAVLAITVAGVYLYAVLQL
jgi:Protein of unknown function (DUF3667)